MQATVQGNKGDQLVFARRTRCPIVKLPQEILIPGGRSKIRQTCGGQVGIVEQTGSQLVRKDAVGNPGSQDRSQRKNP